VIELNLLFASLIKGRRITVSLLKLLIIEFRVDYVFLLGDIIDSSILWDLYSVSNGRLYCITGVLDGVNIATIASKLGVLLDSKTALINEYRVFGVGYNVQQALLNLKGLNPGEIDILLSYYPGYKYSRDKYGVESIDMIIDYLKPKIIVYGKCRETYEYNQIYCLDKGFKGRVLLLRLNDSIESKRVDLYEHYKIHAIDQGYHDPF